MTAHNDFCDETLTLVFLRLQLEILHSSRPSLRVRKSVPCRTARTAQASKQSSKYFLRREQVSARQQRSRSYACRGRNPMTSSSKTHCASARRRQRALDRSTVQRKRKISTDAHDTRTRANGERRKSLQSESGEIQMIYCPADLLGPIGSAT